MSTSLRLLLGGKWIAKVTSPAYKIDLSKGTAVVPTSAFVKDALAVSPEGARKFDLVGGAKTSTGGASGLADETVSVDLSKIDAWQEVNLPYKNIFAARSHVVETLPSRRKVTVLFNGQEVASSNSWMVLFEAGAKPYPTRYYIPEKDVRLDIMEKTELSSHCPFKGDASYYSIKPDGENLVWYYPTPIEHCKNIKDTVCFYLEKPGFELKVEGGPIEFPENGFEFDV